MEFGLYPGILLTDEEGAQTTRRVIGETPISPELFSSLRRAMQLQTLLKIEDLPEN